MSDQVGNPKARFSHDVAQIDCTCSLPLAKSYALLGGLLLPTLSKQNCVSG